MMVMLVLAVAALVVPLVGLGRRVAAAGPAATGPVVPTAKAAVGPPVSEGQIRQGRLDDSGRIPDSVAANVFGIRNVRDAARRSKEVGEAAVRRSSRGQQQNIDLAPQSNEPAILSASSPSSTAVAVTIGGRDTQFEDVELLADWDGREDLTADRQGTIDDFSQKIPPPGGDWTMTRVAVSAHSIANGYAENVFYYGDSFGNLYVAQSPTLGTVGTPLPAGGLTGANIFSINLPTALNAFGTLNSDDQIVVTGIAVSPVADLTSFANVNGAFASFAGQIGEIIYVSFTDTGSGFRLTANNTIVRSGVLAFPVADVVSLPATPPGIQSPAAFPVQVGGAFGVAFSVFSNLAGVAVDDDGSIYFQQVDLTQFTGGNIVKITDTGANQDRSAATNGFITISTLNPAGGQYGSASGPAAQVNTFTNYSGTSTTFGNIASIWAGAGNVLYAAVARSAGTGADASSGLFPAPAALSATGTPSMIISFADCAGAFDVCSGLTSLGGIGGAIPIANGIADVAGPGLSITPGVNNFRVFALGTGPDIRDTTAGTLSAVRGTVANTLKIDFQVDYTIHSGLMVDEVNKVYVVSGGTPGAIGTNPSPTLGEIVVFEDYCPSDRRGDFVDLRGNQLPNPPASGGNVGDGDSDIFDLTFWKAPFDVVSGVPTGLAGLSRGFLRYLNRTAPIAIADLPNGATQGDDDTAGPIIFEAFDLGHQAAGGDDQNTPFRGDDDNGAGNPVLAGPLSGGFEFVFGGPVGTSACVWNGFFLNSNGNITFGTGDTDPTASVVEFRAGLPKIAPAWTDLNPASRAGGILNTFPVQALGFAEVNAFKIRWINVPEFGLETCGSRNTFSITLYDDGTGIDENASQALNPANPIGNNAVPFDLQEGPTDLRFTREPNTGILVGCPRRGEGTGHFFFDYGRMDLLGTAGNPVITGYSIGGLNPLNPPGLCEINLSEAGRSADVPAFGVIQGATAVIQPCLIGEGTEPTTFELFNEGTTSTAGSGGEQTLATPDFDLRFEGNDPVLCTPTRQTDANRGRLGFFGIGCAPPPAPLCRAISVGAFQVPPNTPTPPRLINALCAVQLNAVGCGFFPNETTIICQGFSTDTGIPLQRNGKTVTTAQTLTCDTNGDGIPEATIVLGSVTPVSPNLVRGTLNPLTAAGLPGTAFPLACCGGAGVLTTTTTFTAGDNNVFGPFTRSSTCSIDLGLRAPVVISISPSEGDCAIPQNTIITGACFLLPNGAPNVTSVFAVQIDNPANVIQAQAFVVLSNNLIDALFNFGTVNRGRTFLIFVSGPNGTSRNLRATDPRPAGCPTGNEQGVTVTFTCAALQVQCPAVPTLAPCQLIRRPNGVFQLNVSGSNIQAGATITINGQAPRANRVRFRNGRFEIKNPCNLLPGTIVVTNPGTPPQGCSFASAPLACNERCPTGQ